MFARKMSSIVLNSPLVSTKSQRSIKSFDIHDPAEDFIAEIVFKIDKLRKLCWSNLGVSRNKENMIVFLKNIQDDIHTLKKNALLNSLEKLKIDQQIRLNEPNRRGLNLLLDLQNRQITTATLIKACLFREESRGGHYRDDFPAKSKNWECHTRQQSNKKIQKIWIKT